VSLYLINLRLILINRLSGLCAIAVVCVLLLTAGAGISANPNSRISSRGGKPAADINDSNGPTVALSYNGQPAEKNTTSSFMYFVPLISPTLVETESSANNEQQAGLVSYKRKVTSKSFHVSCEFEMLGKGFVKNTFDAQGVMALFLPELKRGEPLTNALDYIQFEGEGLGRLDVRGTITGSTETVTEVDLHFNARGQKSPVTIGLYSIDPVNGQYKYENRYNELVARVATLTFKKCDGEPRMGVKVVSVNKATNPNGYLGRIKGTIANFFLEPPAISKLGNDTMLNFGYAMLKEKPMFTFPKAKNIREPGTLTTKNKQK